MHAEDANGVVPHRALGLLLAAILLLTPACAGTGGENGGGTDGGGSSEATSAPPVSGGDISSAAKAVTPSVVIVANVQQQEGVQVPAGTGSGVVIREDGHILTNNHVIAQSDQVVVRIGGDRLDAEVVGRDPSSDLAVIKVDRDGLDAAEIGDPGALEVGQWLIAVGFPFGLDETVTSGIVSGLGRTTVQPTEGDVTAYTNLIQTDAAINPGNSGGALADLSGRVVGINTLIESQTGQSAGIGFAIPIDFAMDVAEQLIETGRAEHAFMGVGISSVDPHGLGGSDEASQGAIVQSVEEGSPAAEAGLEQGDIITRIGDTEIEDSSDVFAAVRSSRPGDTVEVEYLRDGESQTAEVTLVGRTSEPQPQDQQGQQPDGGTPELPPGHP